MLLPSTLAGVAGLLMALSRSTTSARRRTPYGLKRGHGANRTDLSIAGNDAPAHRTRVIHFHAFVFLVLTLAIPLLLAGGIGTGLARAAPFAIMISHYAGLRRVFGGSRLQTAWKGTAIWVVYVSLVMAMMITVGLRSVRSVTAEGKRDKQGLEVAVPATSITSNASLLPGSHRR